MNKIKRRRFYRLFSIVKSSLLFTMSAIYDIIWVDIYYLYLEKELIKNARFVRRMRTYNEKKNN